MSITTSGARATCSCGTTPACSTARCPMTSRARGGCTGCPWSEKNRWRRPRDERHESAQSASGNVLHRRDQHAAHRVEIEPFGKKAHFALAHAEQVEVVVLVDHAASRRTLAGEF